ncbi:subtilisin-like protein [Sistotremastrum suecicum HHB10207 ss-3]|uniref:tripeptidyl-peptidase II n=1 Tax=Sistotremastrum suecicum HHB10207 ss-3 TaxID=1314776 RepID=A0A166DPJ9_9AGAM|nr:subtilisin-like protein [Sistotremastrum suecicum HHB10207 ss-3]
MRSILSALFLLSSYTAIVVALPHSSSIAARSLDLALKDKLHVPPRKWIKGPPAPADHIIHLKFGIKQNEEGLETIREHLSKSSDPSHELYTSHLSHSDILSLTAPSPTSLSLLSSWLSDHSISPTSHKHTSSLSGDFLTVSLPIEKAEKLLNASYSVYEHCETGAKIVRTEEYWVPRFVDEVVEFVAPTTWFSRMHANKKPARFVPFTGEESTSTVVDTGVDVGANVNISAICDVNSVTSVCLRTFYGSIDYVVKAADKNLVGVTGYLGETALKSDLQLFLLSERPEASNHTFAVTLINGGTNPQTLNKTQIEEGIGQEANLDTQTVFGVTFPIPEVFFSTGGSPPFLADAFTPTDTNEPYLQWVEFMMDQKKLPSVVTTSYDDDEQTVPFALASRVCTAFMILSARGVSLLFASGDEGVGPNGTGEDDVCLSNDGRNRSVFLPEFPSTCPFVTSVGATQNFNPEIAVTQPTFDFFSGGGFSNYFPRPSYQDAEVGAYVRSLGRMNEGLFNPNGRAIPDVSAQGLNFKIAWNGKFGAISGTSASTPLFSSFVTLLNDARLARGQQPLGFLNPWLYSIGKKGLNDITQGASVGCNTGGFPAAKGWDAVTGLGTPNFKELLKLI